MTDRQRGILFCVATGIMSLCGTQACPAPPRDAAPKRVAAPVAVLREGSDLNEEEGTFSVADGRLVFVTAKGDRRFTALENLCLERVARILSETPSATTWSVSGTVSEYRNMNYVLLRRASLLSRQWTSASPSTAGGGAGKVPPPAQPPSKGGTSADRAPRLP